jgi:hypothetical protein
MLYVHFIIYILKGLKKKMNFYDLSFQLKLLGQGEQIKPKVSQRKDIM